VAIVRLSGPDAHAIALRLFEPMSGLAPKPRRSVHGHVRLADDAPDEALCTLFAGPASFTGEDTAELSVHGNPWVVESIVDAARECGARPARPGEFTYRAWRNGRIDLTRAEAIDSIVRAASPAAAIEAARQAAGGLATQAEEVHALLVAALAEIEAAIDFLEDGAGGARIDEALGDAERAARAWVEGARRARVVEEGFRVVLTGPPNAGKSSLFNALLSADRAIVTAEPGTTRDVLEGRLVLGHLPVVLFDTAGERVTPGPAEAEGVRRGRAARAAADLVLDVRDASVPGEPPQETPSTWAVLNKIDLLEPEARSALPSGDGTHLLSATRGDGLDRLLRQLETRVRAEASGEGALLLAARQRDVAVRLHAHLETARAEREAGRSEEFVAEWVRRALLELAELTGASDPERVYDQVFSRFCVGK
jgi:tRNA modification GTPase